LEEAKHIYKPAVGIADRASYRQKLDLCPAINICEKKSEIISRQISQLTPQTHKGLVLVSHRR
jgi:hypothetical protein